MGLKPIHIIVHMSQLQCILTMRSLLTGGWDFKNPAGDNGKPHRFFRMVPVAQNPHALSSKNKVNDVK